MSRLAIDADTALRLPRDERVVPETTRLVAPASLRSDVLARLYAEVRSGARAETDGRRDLVALAGLRVRLLGDRVSRATAWRIARDLDWSDVRTAEYLAVAVLQADALVTDDAALRAGADGRVALAAYPDLFV